MQGSKVLFVGGGNMGSALVGGLIRNGWAPENLSVIDPHQDRRESLRQNFGVNTNADPSAEAAEFPVVVWAVKPQEFLRASEPYRSFVSEALQVSVMAGIKVQTIREATGSPRVVRSMPNSPALVGEGVTGVYASPEVSPYEKVHAEALLASTSAVVWFEDESHLDAVTAVSGTGPAYVFYLMEILYQAAEELGFTGDQARKLVIGTCLGAAKLAEKSDLTPGQLRAQVTSRGGTTAAAMEVLDQAEVKAKWVQAVHAACHRAQELGKT